MLEQLKELLEMQGVLDEAILKEHGNIYDEKIADQILGHLFILGNKLGFTWSEIYEAYKAKNAVNYERLKNGY